MRQDTGESGAVHVALPGVSGLAYAPDDPRSKEARIREAKREALANDGFIGPYTGATFRHLGLPTGTVTKGASVTNWSFYASQYRIVLHCTADAAASYEVDEDASARPLRDVGVQPIAYVTDPAGR